MPERHHGTSWGRVQPFLYCHVCNCTVIAFFWGECVWSLLHFQVHATATGNWGPPFIGGTRFVNQSRLSLTQSVGQSALAGYVRICVYAFLHIPASSHLQE